MVDKQNPDNPDESRRNLIKTVAAGGTLGLKSIPAKWASPVIASVVLPAHAAVSAPPGPTPPCECPDGNETNFSTSGRTDLCADGFFSGDIGTDSNGSLTGSYDKGDFNDPIDCGPCGSGSAAGGGGITFGGGNLEIDFNYSLSCGEFSIRYDFTFSGTSEGDDSCDAFYVGNLSASVDGCKYSDKGVPNLDGRSIADGVSAIRSLRGRARNRFRFGG